MATIPKAILDLLTNSKTAKFAESLKHSDLPTGWADDPEIVDLAAKAWQEAGTDSPFFKAWFGGSKVVDDAGKPMQVYHGTNAYDLKKFKPGKTGLLGGGIYTTPNEKLALRYTDYPDTGIYSLYEKMENPFRVTDMDAANTILGEIYGSKTEKELAKRIDKQGNAAQIITKKDAQKIQDKGYDGIFWDVFAGKEYSTLDPTAIKSVNNRGTFNPSDPNIYRTLAPLGVGTAAMAAALLGDGSEAEAAETSEAQNNGISASLLRSLGIGARDALEGLGEGVGFVANPFANLLNTAAGGSPKYFSEANAGRALADLLGLPAAESDAEKFLGGISRGAASVLPTMGAGVALNAAKAAPLLANDLLASPRMQAAFGAGIGGFDQALRYLLDGD